MEKRWLSLKEAAKYASIGEHRLLRLARSGTLRACQDRTHKRQMWVFDRISIDQYWEAQMNAPSARDEALAIMRRVGL